MRDLDMGDVMADASDMRDQYYNQIFNDLDRRFTPELEELRYKLGIQARGGNSFSQDVLGMLDHIMLTRTVTTLCEGCLGRTGCDMCCPPDFSLSDMYPEYDPQTDHYERFGRPEFPNEY